MKRIVIIIRADVKSNFDQARGPDGEKWLPLKHPRLRGGDKPLSDRGILMASVTVAGAPGNFEQIAGSTLIYGSNLEYAAIHHYGGLIEPNGHPFLAIPMVQAALDVRARDYPEPLRCIIGQVGGVLIDGVGTVIYALARSVYIPARPFLGIGDRLGTKIAIAIEDYYFPGEAVPFGPPGMVRQGESYVLDPARLGAG